MGERSNLKKWTRQLLDFLNAEAKSDAGVREAKRWYLHAFMRSWIEAQYRLDQWTHAYVVEADLNRPFSVLNQDREGKVSIHTISTEKADVRHYEFRGPTGAFHLDWPQDVEDARGDGLEGRLQASRIFVHFLGGPFLRSIRICKKAGCGRFFLKTSPHAKKLCPKCSRGKAAKEVTYSSRDRERSEKLQRILDAIWEYERAANTHNAQINEPWKVWVSKKAGVSQNFVTATLNKGEITEPSISKPLPEVRILGGNVRSSED